MKGDGRMGAAPCVLPRPGAQSAARAERRCPCRRTLAGPHAWEDAHVSATASPLRRSRHTRLPGARRATDRGAARPAGRASAARLPRQGGGAGRRHRHGAGRLRAQFRPGAPPLRYPDPDIVVLDKRFKYKLGNTPIQRLYTGTLWAEGPAWNGVGRYLLWSDIPNDEHLRWLEEDGHVSASSAIPAGNSNGNTFDYQGRQIACEHGTRRVVRYEHDGKVTVLADKFDGQGAQRPERRRGASERRLDLVHRSRLRQR